MYSILQAKKTIHDGIKTYLEKDESGNYLMDEVNCLPFYLEGAPGIGKTQIVGQLAKEMGLGYVSFSLVHHTRNSLLGLPVISELENGDKFTSFTISEIIAKVYEQMEKGYNEGILLLDEFPCMSETIMPTMLAFLQTKNIGAHALPRGWVLVLCGNPAKYNKATHSFDAAVTDRIRKIEIEYQVNDFLKYARENNLSKYIISYLEVNPSHMYRYAKDKQHEELVTCRSWENLSHTLTVGEKLNNYVDEDLVGQFLKSEEIANNFTLFYRNQIIGMDIDEAKTVLEGKLADTLITKYQDIPLNKKWNLSAYLRSHLEKEIKLISCSKYEIKAAERVLECISDKRDLTPYMNNVLSVVSDVCDIKKLNAPYDFINYNNLTAELIGKHIMDKLNMMYPLDENIDVNLADAINEWAKLVEYVEDDKAYIKEFNKMLKKWIKVKSTVSKETVKKVGESVGNIFEFLEKIDETGALSERFYVEVCNTQVLLQTVCFTDNQIFSKMCCKHYGINIA